MRESDRHRIGDAQLTAAAEAPSREMNNRLNDDPTIVEVLAELEARPDVLGVAVFGSTARRDQRPNSDIDLYVLVSEGSWRDVDERGGRNFEYVFSSEADSRAFWKGQPDEFVKMWSEGHILFDKTGKLQEFRDEAASLRQQGRPRLDERSVRHLEFDARDSLRAVEALQKSDPPTAALSLHKLLEALSSLSFALDGQWVPAPKERLRVLREKSPDMARAFDDFYLSPDFESSLAAAREVVDRVFAAK